MDIDEGEQLAAFLRDELKLGHVEVGILDRVTSRESKFRLLGDTDLEPLLKEYR